VAAGSAHVYGVPLSTKLVRAAGRLALTRCTDWLPLLNSNVFSGAWRFLPLTAGWHASHVMSLAAIAALTTVAAAGP
jgi:hypothetical protein